MGLSIFTPCFPEGNRLRFKGEIINYGDTLESSGCTSIVMSLCACHTFHVILYPCWSSNYWYVYKTDCQVTSNLLIFLIFL